MEKIKIGKYNAIIRFNNDNDSPNYTITDDNINGGVVISDISELVAKEKFIEAMRLFEAAKKLLYYSKFGCFSDFNNN